jgi:hypothetical protein
MKIPFAAILIISGTLMPAFGVEVLGPQSSLAKVRRIYVDQLGGGKTSDQMRDMIIAALQSSGLFVITENQERADASLKGSSDDLIYTEEHHLTESIGLNASAGSGSSNRVSGGIGSSARQNAGASVSQNETSHIQERRHEASAAVRLVDADGDVIWSTVQESNGAKFRGAMADVADKIIRHLVEETKKARCGADPRVCGRVN